MKQKVIMCLFLIGLTGFNLIGCTHSDKDIPPKNEQQENVSNENSKTNQNDITETDNDSDTKSNAKTAENSKITNNKDKTVKENNETQKTQESTKQIYINKLDIIELGMKDLDEKDATGITANMVSAAGERHKRWDDALNEIYGVLKKQLSSDDMKKLENEEIKWISYRDNTAKNDSSPYEGGSIYPYIYTLSLAETTKERCYELVEKYIK